jgi:plastocyanin
LMGFGFLTSLLSANLTPKLLKASGVIVILLGAVMLNRGLAVTGTGIDFNTMVARVAQKWSPVAGGSESSATEQTISMEVLKTGFSPNRFTLRQGVPVKWIIEGKELNECNREIVIPQYDLKIKIEPGNQTIEFTPKETGVVPWSCWMGMMPGTFIIVENKLPPDGMKTVKPASLEEIPAKETDRQRLIREFKEMWRRLISNIEEKWA